MREGGGVRVGGAERRGALLPEDPGGLGQCY